MLLLEKFIAFFKCVACLRIKKDSRNLVHYYEVSSIKDITNNIIPFFNKYNTIGIKSLNFVDWCEGAEIIKSKAHLSKQGVEQISATRRSRVVKDRNWIIKLLLVFIYFFNSSE